MNCMAAESLLSVFLEDDHLHSIVSARLPVGSAGAQVVHQPLGVHTHIVLLDADVCAKLAKGSRPWAISLDSRLGDSPSSGAASRSGTYTG